MSFRRALLLLVAWSTAGPSYALEPVVLTDGDGPYQVLRMETLPDSTGDLTIDDVAGPAFNERFAPTPVRQFRHSWTRFALTNQSQETYNWTLVTYMRAIEVTAYVRDASGTGWIVQRSGETVPVDEAPVRARFPAHHLRIAPGETLQVYLYTVLPTGEPLPVLSDVWSADGFAEDALTERLLLGLYYGVIAVMVLYNLFIFLSLRDIIYLHYVIAATLVGVFFLGWNGIGREYLWTDTEYVFHRIWLTSSGIAFFSLFAFARGFLQTRSHAPRIDRMLQVLSVYNLASSFGGLVGLHGFFLSHLTLLVFFQWLLLLVAGIVVAIRGYRQAIYFLIAWGPYVTGGFLYSGVFLGLVPRTEYTMNALQIGHAIEVVLLSLALANRINILRQEKEVESARASAISGELEKAHELQMGLMPKAPPQVVGLEVAGRCLPASQVGGDFFQYFESDGRLSLCLADVTGHAMEAAVPVMMFSGVLETEMQYGHPLQELMTRLNQLLHRKLDRRTFVCFAMVEVDIARRTARVCNGGCPHPYHYRAATQELVELDLDAYPLGAAQRTHYGQAEIALASGDRVVLCSDGLMEAVNVEGQPFGPERLSDAVREACLANETPAAFLDRLNRQVRAFAGDTPQGDDQTCVVLQAM